MKKTHLSLLIKFCIIFSILVLEDSFVSNLSGAQEIFDIDLNKLLYKVQYLKQNSYKEPKSKENKTLRTKIKFKPIYTAHILNYRDRDHPYLITK